MGISALTAGITQGIAGELGITGTEGLTWQNAGTGAIRAVVNHGVNKVVGEPSQFSWAKVAASAIAEPVGNAIGGQIASGLNIENPFLRDFTGGAIASTVRMHGERALGVGGKIDYLNVATDAFGNAIGNSIARAQQQTEAEQRQSALDAFSGQVTERANQAISLDTDNRIEQLLQKNAENLSQTALLNQPVNKLEQVSSFANSEAGFDLANRYVNQSQNFSNVKAPSYSSMDLTNYKLGTTTPYYPTPAGWSKTVSGGYFNDELFATELNKLSLSTMPNILDGLGTLVNEAEYQRINDYRNRSEVLGKASTAVGGMSLGANVLSGAEY